MYLAVLISGTVNRVIVYDYKNGKAPRPVAAETFPIVSEEHVAAASPTAGD